MLTIILESNTVRIKEAILFTVLLEVVNLSLLQTF